MVITIIILLILAGITIAQLTENGLFGKAKLAEKRTRYENAKEIVNMKLMEIQLDCEEKEEEYTIIKIAEGMKQTEEITIEKYYNKETASIKEGITENTTNLEGIVVSVDEYSEYKFLIGESCEIKVALKEITEETSIEEFTDVETFEEKTFGSVVGTTDNIEFSYARKRIDDNKKKLLITIKDEVNGLSKIEYPNGDILNCGGKKQVAIDYEIECEVEYVFKITSNNGYEKEMKICENPSAIEYLIKDGLDNIAITGGWEGIPHYGRETGTLDFDENKLGYADFTGARYDTVYTKATSNSIDWSEYTTLKMRAVVHTRLSGYGSYGAIHVGVAKKKNSYDNDTLVCYNEFYRPSGIEEVIFTTELPDDYIENTYIALVIHRCNAYIYDVWLE